MMCTGYNLEHQGIHEYTLYDIMCTGNILEHQGMPEYRIYDIMCTRNILEHQGMHEYRSVWYNVHRKYSRMNKLEVLQSKQHLHICHPMLPVLVRRTIIKLCITNIFKSVSALTISTARILMFLKIVVMLL